jgi:2-keto-3-deoxy-L-fuconate dehydrogenase
MRFAGQTALVTGAASGIGLAAARLLAAEGARLVLVDVDGAALDRADVAGARIAGSVADEATWEAAAPHLAALDLAVLSAGVARGAPLADLPFAEWRRVLSVNLDGAFLGLRAAMEAMAGRGGAIVAVGSAAGVKAQGGTAAYGASKAALHHLVRVAAAEGAADRIRVNALAPAGVDTPIWDAAMADRIAAVGRAAAMAELGGGVPLGRVATADETAAQIAFLLSDAAATITGAVLVADGGYTL